MPTYRRDRTWLWLMFAAAITGVWSTTVLRADPDQSPRQGAGRAPAPQVAPIYLSDLKPADSEVYHENGWGLGLGGFSGDAAKSRIHIDGQEAAHALALHAAAGREVRLVYDLNESYTSLSGDIALDDSTPATDSSMVFRILVDGREAWQSKPVKEPRHRQSFDVGVSHARRVELRVGCAGAVDAAVGVWVDPTLTPKTRFTYLTSLTPSSYRVYADKSWGLGTKGALGSSDGRRASVGGVPSPHGLALHAIHRGQATVAYKLLGDYQRLAGQVAMDDSAHPAGSTQVFSIYADGHSVWRSSPIRAPGEPESFELDVRGVTTLELRVTFMGNAGDDVAVWAEPRLLPVNAPTTGWPGAWLAVTAPGPDNTAPGNPPASAGEGISRGPRRRARARQSALVAPPSGVQPSNAPDAPAPGSGGQGSVSVVRLQQASVKTMAVAIQDDDRMVGLTMDLIATVAPERRGRSAGDAVVLGAVGQEMLTSFAEAERVTRLRFPNWGGQHIEFSFSSKYSGHDGGSAGAACALLFRSLFTGIELDPGVAITGDVTVDGKVRRIGGLPAKLRGALVDKCSYALVPTDNADGVVDTAVLQGDDLLWDLQVFSMSNLDEGLGVLRRDRAQTLTQAMREFAALAQNLKARKGPGLRSQATRDALAHILSLAPNHLSAQVLLDHARATRPRTLSASASVYELALALQPCAPAIWGGPDAVRVMGDLDRATASVRKSLQALTPICSAKVLPLVEASNGFVSDLDRFRRGETTVDTFNDRRHYLIDRLTDAEANRELLEKLVHEGSQ